MAQRQATGLRVGLIGRAADTDAAAVSAALRGVAGMLPQGGVTPLLRFLCQETADAAIPRAAEQAGWTVHRVFGLPAGTMPDDALVLDGSASDPAAAAAAAAGLVLRNADVLIALGDAIQEPLAGQVKAALGLGVPVLWLSPDRHGGQPVRLLLDQGWPVARDPAPEGEAAWDALRQSVSAVLDLPAGIPADAAGLLVRAPLPDRRLWRVHRRAMTLLWRTPPLTARAEPPPPYWAALYDPADALAGGYADRYRSSYTLVLGLAAAALMAAVLGLALPISPLWTALPEAACLAGIIVLVRANARLDWRSRMILFRLLSELCRKQAALSFLGRSLPAARIARLTEGGELGWVGWRFAAAVRAAPLPHGVLAGASLAAARDAAAAVLLRGQRTYHHARVEAGRRREARLVHSGEWAFGLTVACVAVKLALLTAGEHHHAEQFGLVATLLPALAAALFGFRAYAELELAVQHSERMIHVLDGAARSLDRTDTGRPLASQHIGDVLEDTAVAMLADVEGWIQISRVKAVEAG